MSQLLVSRNDNKENELRQTDSPVVLSMVRSGGNTPASGCVKQGAIDDARDAGAELPGNLAQAVELIRQRGALLSPLKRRALVAIIRATLADPL